MAAPTGDPTAAAKVQATPVPAEQSAMELEQTVGDLAESMLREAEQHQSDCQKICGKKKRTVCPFTGCTNKIKYSDTFFQCVCRKVFCREHRFFANHKCPVDRRKMHQDWLANQLDLSKKPKRLKSNYHKPESNSSY